MEAVKKAVNPTWPHLASSVNWDVQNTDRFTKTIGDVHKILEGRRIEAIISMASVIEGSLRTYLFFRNDFIRREKEIIEGILENDMLEKLKCISMYDSREDYEEQLQVLNSKINMFSKHTTGENIKEKNWGKLKGAFNQFHVEKFSTELSKMNDKKEDDLEDDLKHLFIYRHFLVHSNFISMNISDDSIEYKEKMLQLVEYLKKINLYDTNIQSHIERLLPLGLVEHFNKKMNDFLNLGVFKKFSFIKPPNSNTIMIDLLKKVYKY